VSGGRRTRFRQPPVVRRGRVSADWQRSATRARQADGHSVRV